MTEEQNALRVGIVGLGTVGASTVQLIQEHADLLAERAGRPISIQAVCARAPSKDRGVSLGSYEWLSDPIALARYPHIDVVVELIGGEDGPAKAVVEAALSAGKHVVTANKALIARHGRALAELAELQNTQLRFEAAVTGAIPAVKAFREAYAANEYRSVKGIMNGTCNFILNEMQAAQRDFDDVLQEAQALGYAEADPTFDVDGIDTAHKLAILSSLAYGTAPDLEHVYCEGIRHISTLDIAHAERLGYCIKLLGIATPTHSGLEQRVHPCMVPKTLPLANVPAQYNAVEVELSHGERLFQQGPGAGGAQTASAVVADILDIARYPVGAPYHVFGVPAKQLKTVQAARMDDHVGCYYLQFKVVDRPGVMAGISTRFLDQQISVKACYQHSRNPGEEVQMVLTTHETREAALMHALRKITNLDFMIKDPTIIRIEE